MSKLAQAMKGERAPTPFATFRAQVEKLRPEIAALCGKENVDRFVRVCLNAVQSTPAVLDADRKSLLLACLRAAQDRLMPDGREAVLNVYNTKVKAAGQDVWIQMVQYLPMVGGLVKKLYESGHVTFVDAVAVRERDVFRYQRGDDPRIFHEPYVGEEDPGKVIAAYLVAKLKNGEVKREVMSRRDIELVRSKSKSSDGMLWSEDGGFYDQAAIKSVIKRAYKQLPSSFDIDRAIEADNAAIGLASEADATSHATEELAALVDMRVEQRANAVPPVPTKETVAAPAASGASELAQGRVIEGGVSQDIGETERLKLYLAKIAKCSDVDVLGVLMDETRFHDWTPEAKRALDKAYHARVQMLENPEPGANG